MGSLILGYTYTFYNARFLLPFLMGAKEFNITHLRAYMYIAHSQKDSTRDRVPCTLDIT